MPESPARYGRLGRSGWISIISFTGVSMDFMASVGFRYFARGFRLLAGPLQLDALLKF